MGKQEEAKSVPHGSEDVRRALDAFAAGDWEQANRLLTRLDEQGGSLPAAALEALAFARAELGRIPEACKTLERAFVGFVQDGDKRHAATLAAHLVALYEVVGADAACRGWERRGLRLIEDLEPCLERGYLALARTGCEILDPVDLEERASVALQRARAFGDHDLELRARAEMGLALVGQGRVNAGFELLDEVMVAVAAGELTDKNMQARAVCSMLSACERTGDVARAEYWCTRIEHERELQHLLLGTHCRVTRGVVEALRGEWDRAERLLTEAMEADLAVTYHRAMSAGRLAEVMIQQGRYEAAAAVLTGYEDRPEAIPALARLRMVEGAHEQAAGLLRSVVRDLVQDSIRLAPVLAQLVEVEVLLRDRSGAERALERLRALDERCDSSEIRAHTRLAAGRLARFTGELETAVEALESALTSLAQHDRPWLRAQIRLELARTLVQSGALGQAIVEVEAALATFRRLGAVADADAAEALRGALSEPGTPSGPPGGQGAGGRLAKGPDGLTPREAEVAALVAAGLTNREIAERLVVSVRTVEGHVDRALGKLGLHTRTQLAMAVAQGPEDPLPSASPRKSR